MLTGTGGSFPMIYRDSRGGVKRWILPILRCNVMNRMNIVQKYTAEVARAMPKLCHQRERRKSKKALATTLKVVTYISIRFLRRAVNALAMINPIAIGVKPITKPRSVLAVRFVSVAENAPR